MGRTLGEVLLGHVPPLWRAIMHISDADNGQGLVEYALIMVLLVLVAIVSVGMLGTTVNDLVAGAAVAMPPP